MPVYRDERRTLTAAWLLGGVGEHVEQRPGAASIPVRACHDTGKGLVPGSVDRIMVFPERTLSAHDKIVWGRDFLLEFGIRNDLKDCIRSSQRRWRSKGVKLQIVDKSVHVMIVLGDRGLASAALPLQVQERVNRRLKEAVIP